jgi:thioredoxin reductase (NADPH)
MGSTAVIGDGPAGLSAALFLAKNDHDVTVYGRDESAMHYALVRNYLGIEEIAGTDFQRRAREQARGHGAELVDDHVTGVRAEGGRFVVATEGGRQDTVDHVVLAAAKKGSALAEALGAASSGGGIDVDTEYRTSVDGVYAVGRLARPNRSQAIISAGAGAVAALDILSGEAGEDVTDWDSPPKDG